MGLSALSASAPPWAATACFTRSCADCAAAGFASIAPHSSATPDIINRCMLNLPVVEDFLLQCPSFAEGSKNPTPDGRRYSALRPRRLLGRFVPGPPGGPRAKQRDRGQRQRDQDVVAGERQAEETPRRLVAAEHPGLVHL